MTDKGEYMTTYIEDWFEDIDNIISECENELLSEYEDLKGE